MKKVNKEIAATAAIAPAASAATAPAPILVVLKHDAQFRGIRQAWYERALAYDGKPVAEFLAVPDGGLTQYTSRSKHVGTAHSPKGYLGGLLRRGMVKVV